MLLSQNGFIDGLGGLWMLKSQSKQCVGALAVASTKNRNLYPSVHDPVLSVAYHAEKNMQTFLKSVQCLQLSFIWTKPEGVE